MGWSRQLYTTLLLAAIASLTCDGRTSNNPRIVTNPLFTAGADPDVLRVNQTDGSVMYYLTHTVGSGHDFPIYTSKNLVDWSLTTHAFGVTAAAGSSIRLGDFYYCNTWAPEIRWAGSERGGFILSFTASRFSSMQSPCPGYDEGSGVFTAWAKSPLGPFNTPSAHPIPTGADLSYCPQSVHDALPNSFPLDHHNCSPQECNGTMRLDSDLFIDSTGTGDAWFSYSWYSNSEPTTPWDQLQLGEHVSLVKVNSSDAQHVLCTSPDAATKVWIASPHDSQTLQLLNDSCPRCSEQLSFVKGRLGETMQRDGVIWGVVEASMLFRRGDWVYLLASHSAWDSAFYSVMWIAAPSVEELSIDSSTRIVGRFLVPSMDQSFGHGTAILGPDNSHWYYVHHHLDHSACSHPTDPCSRDIYISPIEFTDHGDGRGEVWIESIFPAEKIQVPVYQPDNRHVIAEK